MGRELVKKNRETTVFGEVGRTMDIRQIRYEIRDHFADDAFPILLKMLPPGTAETKQTTEIRIGY